MPAVPTVPIFRPGLSSSSQMQQLADVVTFLGRPPTAELLQLVAQNLATGTGVAMTYTSETLDDDVDGVGGHDNASNTSRFTARYEGWYLCSGLTSFSTNATGRRVVWWAKNGTPISTGQSSATPLAATGIEVAARTIRIYLQAFDYVELVAFQDSGSLLTTVAPGGAAPGMSIGWVRRA